MDKTPESSDEEEEEDWMAINWDGNLNSGIKLLDRKEGVDNLDQSESSTGMTEIMFIVGALEFLSELFMVTHNLTIENYDLDK